MRRSKGGRAAAFLTLPLLLVGLLLVGLLLVVPPGLAAQDAGADTESEDGDLEGLPELRDIDEILEGEDQILSGRGYTYDPGDRRDPFRSLLDNSDQAALDGPRPEGVPGLLIDEIVLSGIFYRPSHGYVGQVQAADRQKSYLIKVGDQLYDGDVVSITRTDVVFRQNVQDPTALKPFREVVKSLQP